jgi:hypothetical protein
VQAQPNAVARPSLSLSARRIAQLLRVHSRAASRARYSLLSPARFSARRRALPAAVPGLRLCRADLRSSVAVEPAQLLARHGPGRHITVCSGSVVSIGRGHGRATRDLGTPSFHYAQCRAFYGSRRFPIHHNTVNTCRAPDVVLVVAGSSGRHRRPSILSVATFIRYCSVLRKKKI